MEGSFLVSIRFFFFTRLSFHLSHINPLFKHPHGYSQNCQLFIPVFPFIKGYLRRMKETNINSTIVTLNTLLVIVFQTLPSQSSFSKQVPWSHTVMGMIVPHDIKERQGRPLCRVSRQPGGAGITTAVSKGLSCLTTLFHREDSYIMYRVLCKKKM